MFRQRQLRRAQECHEPEKQPAGQQRPAGRQEESPPQPGRGQQAKAENGEDKEQAQRRHAARLRPQRAAERQHQQRRPAVLHAALVLLHAQPEDTQPFQRPGHRRPARRQRQRNGERRESAADRQRRHDQRPSEGGIAPQRKEREGEIKCAVSQRAQRRAVDPVLRHAVLHPEADQRRGKQQHTVNDLLPFLLRPQRQRHAQHAEDQRIGNQEQLANPIVFRLVVIQPPQAAHAEGEQQPEEIQLAPVLPDADSENADGQQEIEREQRHKAAAPGR